MGGTGRALCFGALCFAAAIREEAPAFTQLSAAPVTSSPPPAAEKKPFAAAMEKALRRGDGKARRKFAHAQVTAAIAKLKESETLTGFPTSRHAPRTPAWTRPGNRPHAVVAAPPPVADRIGYGGRIPHFIWQTYTTRTIKNEQILKSYDSWSNLNPKWHHELLVDEDVAKFFQEHYDATTNAVFNALPLGAMKADMFRYAVMYTFGGVYADVDVEALVPIGAWLGDRSGSCKVVMGLENDMHFCQWTFAAMPRQRIFKRAVELIVERVVAGGGLGPKGLNVADVSFVHYYTGPAVWTAAVLDVLDPGKNSTCRESRNVTTGEHAYAGCVAERMRDALAMEGVCMQDEGFFHGRNVAHYFHSSSRTGATDGDSWRDAAAMVADEQKVMNSSDYEQKVINAGAGCPDPLDAGCVVARHFKSRDNATAQGGNASVGGRLTQGVPDPALGPASTSADPRLAALAGRVSALGAEQGNVSAVRNGTNHTADLGDQLAQWRRPAATWSDAKAAAHLREEQKHNGL